MLRPIVFALALTRPFGLAACGDESADFCSDDLDCDDGFICEITNEDDGICVDE